jgi:putative ABC transport system permease protein
MWKEVFIQAWQALRHNGLRSLLTMLGIVWGIAAVTLLMAYGDGFQKSMEVPLNNFGRSVIIAFPGQTSQQAGGERAGKRVRFELADLEAAQAESPVIKKICPETIRGMPVAWRDQSFGVQVRGVCSEYGDIRSERPLGGRWLSPEDISERRRVVFFGDYMRKKLFGQRDPVGEVVTIRGVRFTVVGYMDRKISYGNYNGPDDRAIFIPYTTAGDVWDTRYFGIAVVQPISPQFETKAEEQFRAAIARRQGFQPGDKRAVEAFGTSMIRPIIDSFTIGLRVLMVFIGMLTLAIGGIGLMNILLVSVTERTREIGLRRALGARRRHVLLQFLAEAMVLTMAGGALGIAASYAVTAVIPPIPLIGAAFNDTSGKGDLILKVNFQTVLVSAGILAVVGLLSGLAPAVRASRLDPAEALRDE